MSALVCGKRSVFEDRHTSPPASKRLRCSSPANANGSSPIRTRASSIDNQATENNNSNNNNNLQISQLRRLFPEVNEQHLQETLESCGYDLPPAIKCLNELQTASIERNSSSCGNIRYSSIDSDLGQSIEANQGAGLSVEESITNDHVEGVATAIPVNGSDWVELLLREMQSASDMDDARIRASIALEALEKAIIDRTSSVADNVQKENMIIKQQMESLVRDNSILKRAVAIQHERQKEHEERGNEVQHLKQLLSQCQEQIRTLEVNNYALTMHLRQAQANNSIPGRFHPDVF